MDELNLLDAPRNYQTEKREVLILIYVFTVITSFFTLLFLETATEQIIKLGGAVGYGFFILWWCRIDSDEREHHLTAGLSFLLVIFGAFALVYYLLKTRGLSEGLTAVGYAFLLLLGLVFINTLVIAIYTTLFNVDLQNIN